MLLYFIFFIRFAEETTPVAGTFMLVMFGVIFGMTGIETLLLTYAL
jgi:hypothetical protein